MPTDTALVVLKDGHERVLESGSAYANSLNCYVTAWPHLSDFDAYKRTLASRNVFIIRREALKTAS